MSNAQTIKISNTADLRTALEAGYTREQIEVAVPDSSAAVAAARAEGFEAGKSETTKSAVEIGAKAERERLTALAELADEGFEAEHKAAIEAGSSPAEFALAMRKAAKDRGITMGAIRKDSSKVAPHAKTGDDNKGPAASWDSIHAASSKRM